jgi:hypothetical protein
MATFNIEGYNVLSGGTYQRYIKTDSLPAVNSSSSYSASWMGFVVGAGGSRFLLSDVPAIIVMSVLWRPEKGQDSGIEACRE